VTVGRRAWAASAAAGWSLLTARAPAQTTGTVDVGMSTVRYDGFLPSGAASVTPAVRWERPSGTLTARGTYLRFESGHRSLQGSVAGSFFTPTLSRWRGEFSAAAGASRYVEFASFWHAVGEARLHIIEAERGAWISGTAGRASYGSVPRGVLAAGAGAWLRRAALTLRVSASLSRVGDTSYTDVESSARTAWGQVTLDASLGARVWSRGGGRGMYGETSAAVALGERLALVLSGGRYPTDPISGSIAARYLAAAIRIQTAAPRHVVARDRTAPRGAGADGAGTATSARLEVQVDRSRPVRLVVHVADATRVEVAGDFTNWQPRALSRAGGGLWEIVLPITSGVHRIDVRIDGAAWIVPAGATRAPDDYGGDVGIFVVP
jgi:hypothetical protein